MVYFDEMDVIVIGGLICFVIGMIVLYIVKVL